MLKLLSLSMAWQVLIGANFKHVSPFTHHIVLYFSIQQNTNITQYVSPIFINSPIDLAPAHSKPINFFRLVRNSIRTNNNTQQVMPIYDGKTETNFLQPKIYVNDLSREIRSQFFRFCFLRINRRTRELRDLFIIRRGIQRRCKIEINIILFALKWGNITIYLVDNRRLGEPCSGLRKRWGSEEWQDRTEQATRKIK